MSKQIESTETLTLNAEQFLAPRGVYQRAIVACQATMSGADLRGKASKWGAKYAASRAGLVARANARAPKILRFSSEVLPRVDIHGKREQPMRVIVARMCGVIVDAWGAGAGGVLRAARASS